MLNFWTKRTTHTTTLLERDATLVQWTPCQARCTSVSGVVVEICIWEWSGARQTWARMRKRTCWIFPFLLSKTGGSNARGCSMSRWVVICPCIAGFTSVVLFSFCLVLPVLSDTDYRTCFFFLTSLPRFFFIVKVTVEECSEAVLFTDSTGKETGKKM